MSLPGLDLHERRGSRKGTWAVKVSGNWRVTFTCAGKDVDRAWVTFEGRRMPYLSQRRGAHYRLIVAARRPNLERNPAVPRNSAADRRPDLGARPRGGTQSSRGMAVFQYPDRNRKNTDAEG